MNIPLW